MRHFNTTGPVRPEHYQIDPLRRTGLPDVSSRVENGDYFVFNGPRQSGKTSVLRALRDDLNRRHYRAVYCNVEMARVAGNDLESGMRAVLGALSQRAQETLQDDIPERHLARTLAETSPTEALHRTLTEWVAANPAPLVLLIDEIDALHGKMLLSVLDQLRAVYDERARRCSLSVVLCGLRNRQSDSTVDGARLHIADRSVRLGDFSEAEVRELLGQHTAETGQLFTEAAQTDVWTATRGQPWLVNALADEACFETDSGCDRSRAITDDDIAAARERLILRRPTHFRHLADRLQDDRVRRVIDPILAGYRRLDSSTDDDVSYVHDLGFTSPNGRPDIANPIYCEVIPRLLGATAEMQVRHDHTPYRRPDGGLAVPKLFADVQDFFRENAEWWSRQTAYGESAAQVLLQAFLRRVVNAGGQIAREYGLGRGRTRIRVAWKTNSGHQVFVIECRVRRSHDGLETLIAEGVRQTARYAAGCGAEEGHLVVFDRNPERSWDERVFRREARLRKSPITADWEIVEAPDRRDLGDRIISIWGM